ncbi:hypothetical protein F9B64_12740, partial [Staphylococcus epidermidis]
SSWLNIRKVIAQRAENHQKNYKKDNSYIISIEIVFIYLFWNFLFQAFHIYIDIDLIIITMFVGIK